VSIKCTNQDVSRWLQEPTKVGSVSIDTSFELQRVIQNINSEHCETSDRRSVHRDGDDHVVFSVNEGFKMKSPRGDFKKRIHDSARSHASRCHHLTTKHLIDCQPIISSISMYNCQYQRYSAVHVRGAHMTVFVCQAHYQTSSHAVDYLTRK
jgi:hypothetical protein